MKVSELEGGTLDMLVANALGKRNCEIENDGICWEHDPPETSTWGRSHKVLARTFQPSSEWHDGGPLIEKYEVDVLYVGVENIGWVAIILLDTGAVEQAGPTPLIAACRAIVASVYGEEV